MSNINLYPLGSAARMLRVPAAWLHQEAAAGRIPPRLAAGKRLLFDVPTVARILQRRAKKTAGGVHRG